MRAVLCCAALRWGHAARRLTLCRAFSPAAAVMPAQCCLASFIVTPARLPRPRQVLRWLNEVRAEVGDNVTKEQMGEFVWATLKSGKVRLLYLLVPS